MTWDRNTGNGMAEGADAAYERHTGQDAASLARYDEAMTAARDEAETIRTSPSLMAEAIGESRDPEGATRALIELLICTDCDSRRSARKVLARAIAHLAVMRSGKTLRGELGHDDEALIAAEVLEALP